MPSTGSDFYLLNFPFISSPYPWIFFCALFFGAALSRASRFTGKRRRQERDVERAVNLKWLLFSIYLSLSLLFLLGAVFISGLMEREGLRLLYFFSGVALIFFLAFRFKKTAGITFLLLMVLFSGVVLLFLQSISAFTGETEIAKVRVIAVKEDAMRLEVAPANGEPVIIDMQGSYFAPIVRVIIFDDYYVFLGAKSWYRFEGLTSFRVENIEGKPVFKQEDTDFYFPGPAGITSRLYFWFEENEEKIPGVKAVQIEMDLKRARELLTYLIMLQNDGGIQIVIDS